METVYTQIAVQIIERQESVMGPMALQQAMQVPNMAVNWANRSVTFMGDPVTSIDRLVDQYEEMFGKVSVGICRDAAANLVSQLPPEKRPKRLL